MTTNNEEVLRLLLNKVPEARTASGALAHSLFRSIFLEVLDASSVPSELLVHLARAIDICPSHYYVEFLVKSSSVLLDSKLPYLTADIVSLVNCCSFITSRGDLGLPSVGYCSTFPPVAASITEALRASGTSGATTPSV